MISRILLEDVLAAAMSTGADFAEVYAEKTRNNGIRFLDGKIDTVSDDMVSGVGIRAFIGTRTVYATTTDLSRSGLIRCAKAVADALGESNAQVSINLTERIFPNIHPVKILPGSTALKTRTDILKSACFAAKDTDEKVKQVMGNLASVDHTILIANSEGLYTSDRHVRTRIAVSAVAFSADGSDNQSGSASPGRGMGLEMFDFIDPKSVGVKAAEQALVNLRADYCPAGQMTVPIENGFGGVIFHEACGHSLEATSVGTGTSQMCGKMGQQIANVKVTAIDDGTIPNGWGSAEMDDEGTPTARNILIQDGILTSYMVDRLNGRRMGAALTGSARRQDYRYAPTSRMTNTFIANGKSDPADIIANTEYGLYAKQMGGGSVDPATGSFNFAVLEGYMIRNGKIAEPVRGATFIGKGYEVLRDIDMVGNHLKRAQGMCASKSGSVPTDVGQPMIRVSSMTVGGRG
jgi:TldD protein